VAELTSRVWERYGRLRVYVRTGELEVGWSEPRTGRYLIHQPELAPQFWSEVGAECRRLRQEGRLTGPAYQEVPVTSAPQAPSAEPTLTAPRAPSAEPAPTAFTAPVSTPTPLLSAEPAAGQPVDGEITGGQAVGGHAVGGHWIVRDSRWDDLATNKPGMAARARARQLRREHPVRTTAADLLGKGSGARAFRVGAKGERVVGRKLDRWAARYGWRVLHAVPVGRQGTDIDHVVIGPFGVVTVNTKATSTRVWVGEHGMIVGRTTVDYLRKSRAEARRAGRLLSTAARDHVPVQGVIVFTGARRFTMVRGGPRDVAVLRTPRKLRRWLRRQPWVLPADRVEEIYEAARRPESWQGPASAVRRQRY
jgi:Nuclease-related domain